MLKSAGQSFHKVKPSQIYHFERSISFFDPCSNLNKISRFFCKDCVSPEKNDFYFFGNKYDKLFGAKKPARKKKEELRCVHIFFFLHLSSIFITQILKREKCEKE